MRHHDVFRRCECRRSVSWHLRFITVRDLATEFSSAFATQNGDSCSEVTHDVGLSVLWLRVTSIVRMVVTIGTRDSHSSGMV